jgi:CubicO group peptidase (beta-lactamase class C family)
MPPIDPIFDQGPRPLQVAGLVAPAIYDASARAMRQRTANFAAKRYVDMLYVTGLDRTTADAHFRPRMAGLPGDLEATPAADGAALAEAVADGRFRVTADDAARRVTVRWGDKRFGPDVIAGAVAHSGYGGILLGPHKALQFEPAVFARPEAAPLWPGRAPKADPALAKAATAVFKGAPGMYGLLVATPERIVFEKYSGFGAVDRVTPSWSMTKSMTATTIGRLIQLGWLRSVYDRAPAPLWGDPRGVHAAITIDDLLRMRSGLAIPVLHPDGTASLGFENSMVYQDAGDAFATAQRSVAATRPGAVFRYINAGVNVLGAIIRQEIERRGLPYHAALYGLLADKIGMGSFQYSADIAGNMIASGAGFATARDYARLGVLYLNDGVWQGERLLPEGWAAYALASGHTGTNYAASFRTNQDATFPSLPADTAWAVGASDQRIFILRRAGMVAVVTNETDHPTDLAALDRFLAAATGG